MGTARSIEVILDKEDGGIFVGSVGIDIRTIEECFIYYVGARWSVQPRAPTTTSTWLSMGLQCGICYEPFTEPVSIPCGK